MKGYSYLKRAFTWLLTVVITVSYVLPGTAVTAWASEKEEAGEYPLLSYIDDITVLFDGKEAAPEMNSVIWTRSKRMSYRPRTRAATLRKRCLTERWRREWNIRFRCRMYFRFPAIRKRWSLS